MFSHDVQVNGVKGPTWLSTIPEFDLVDGMSVDYMHCVLLGICRQLMKLWLKNKYHKEPWYIGGRVAQLDSRLLAITPPAEIQRTTRSIATTLKFWKG